MNFAISLYDALVAINVPADKAKAVVSALEHHMTTALATKDDINTLSFRVEALSTEFDLKLKAQTNSIVIRLGAMITAIAAVLEALHRFL